MLVRLRLRRQRSLCIGVGKAKDMGESYDNYETFEILAEVGILFYSFQVPSDFILLLLLFYFIASMVGGGDLYVPTAKYLAELDNNNARRG